MGEMITKPGEQTELAFSITARTALLLGRESISSPVVAVLELVKNAYDADATQVKVRFRKASTPNGTVEILDNGHGMSWEDIQTKWMVIGTDNKLVNPVSPGGRVKVGEKGIGRFALDRLAAKVIMETTPRYPSEEPRYRLTIDWNKFVNTSEPLHEIRHPVAILVRHKEPGTRLLLEGLRDCWTLQDYERLYRDLAVLVPPFEARLAEFSIQFDCDEARDLSGPIRSPMAGAALFKMRAALDKKGHAEIEITTRDGSPDGMFKPFKSYQRTWQQLLDAPSEPQCGPITFEFHFYLRWGPALRDTSITRGQLIEFLDIYGGVRIYRDGFRVRPYGDQGGGGDWLNLNQRRTQHPGGVKSKSDKWVVGENQVAASVFISRHSNPELRDQTNREGLFYNQAFRDMRAFVLKCIEIFETDRRQYERSRPSPEPPQTSEVLVTAKQTIVSEIEQIQEVLAHQPDSHQKAVLSDALAQFKVSQAEQMEMIESTYEIEQQEAIGKQRLLQNLATVGIAVSAMGHEVLETSRQITTTVGQLRQRVVSLMLMADDKIKLYTDRLQRYGQIMYSMGNFALGHIDRDRRRWQQVNVDSIIQTLHDETLKEMCATNEADIDLKLGGLPNIYAFPYEVESIVINFVTNSLAAFRRGHTPTRNRHIQIETRYDDSVQQISIIVRDSGPGIAQGDTERIFDIYSTKIDSEGRPIGTGLGLVIVKDIVDSHRGSVKVIENGAVLPGAEFIVTLPVPQVRGRPRRDQDENN